MRGCRPDRRSPQRGVDRLIFRVYVQEWLHDSHPIVRGSASQVVDELKREVSLACLLDRRLHHTLVIRFVSLNVVHRRAYTSRKYTRVEVGWWTWSVDGVCNG